MTKNLRLENRTASPDGEADEGSAIAEDPQRTFCCNHNPSFSASENAISGIASGRSSDSRITRFPRAFPSILKNGQWPFAETVPDHSGGPAADSHGLPDTGHDL
jgi:hypothetical protein